MTAYRAKLRTLSTFDLGGPGSGNFGHAGRPGEVGGSAPEGDGSSEIARLPDAPDTYFQRDASTRMVPLDAVTLPTTFSDPDTFNAAKVRAMGHMADAASGKVPLRPPITVVPTADGRFEIVDGLATVAVLKDAGWKEVPVREKVDVAAEREAGYARPTFAAKVAALKINPRADAGQVFDFESQARQFPATGEPGLAVQREIAVPAKPGKLTGHAAKYVDIVTFRDADGKLRGVAYHYPQDIHPYESKGNVNVIVDPDAQRHGIGTSLLKEADERWDIDFTRQTFTKQGRQLLEGLQAKAGKAKPPKKKRHLSADDWKQQLLDLFVAALNLGGPGSGNFGHAGRPGEIGGSLPDDGQVVFHGTSEQSLSSILKEGLKASHAGQIWPTESQKDHVYVATDEATAQEWATYAAETAAIPGSPARGPRRPPPIVILKIRVPADHPANLIRDTHVVGGEGINRQFKGDIPREWIVGAKIGRPSKPDATVWDVEYAWEDVLSLRATDGQTFYVVLVGKPTPIHLGGEGSGNFGHAGRVGEVGGSAPSEGGRWEKGDGGKEYWVGEGTPPKDPRRFKGNEGYDWHERAEMEEYVKEVPYADVQAVANYASFGYGDINRMLRGTYDGSLVNEFVREATPEEIAKFKPQFWKGDAKSYDPDDPTNKVEDGRIVKKWVDGEPHVIIERAVPDAARIKEIEGQIASVNTYISERGYALTEPMEVHRAAYIPGMTFEDLQAMEGQVMEEKGFTSTMVGNPSNRLDGYVTGGKAESLYKRFGEKESDAIYTHQDEVGAAMRITIVLPEGTKVAPVESLRRVDHEFPKIQDPEVFNHPEWLTKDDGTPNGLKTSDYTIRDYTQKPTVSTARLHDPTQRSEAEILLGSGAQFRVTKVRRGDKRIQTGDPKMKPIDVIDVTLEYIGGGSSDPAAKTLRADYHSPFDMGGPGSGNFGHAGRPGEVGGSSEGAAGGVGAPYFDRNPRLAPFQSIPVVRSEGTGGRHPEAEVDSRGRIHLYPKFDKLKPAVQDFVFAHEVGHAVLDEKGLAALVPDAEALGIDVWDTDNLPFGQNNMHEAFADAFASYHTDREVVTRYPAWAKLVEKYAERQKALNYRERLSYLLGGAGSGNFGHAGRPGEVGGSSGGGAEAIPAGKQGECFRNAAGWVRAHEDFDLVHGKVTNGDGRTFDHAWAETTREVADPTTGVRMDKDQWYGLVKAQPEAKYSNEQAMVNMLRTKNLGPWTAEEIGHRKKALSYRERLALLLGGEGSGNFGHAGRPGEVGGSVPSDGGVARESSGGYSSAAEKKYAAIMDLLKAEAQREADVDVLRQGVKEAWKVWSEDVNNRKKPLKPDGAAAKKLDSYKKVMALEAAFHAENDDVREQRAEMEAQVTEMLKVPPAERSKVVFEDDKNAPLYSGVAFHAKRALKVFRQYDGSGAFEPFTFEASMVNQFKDAFGKLPLVENADGTFSVPERIRLAKAETDRAHAMMGKIFIGSARELERTVYHEVAHQIEMKSPAVLKAAIAYREARADTPREVFKLNIDNPSLDDHEEAVRGKFKVPYAGKIYPHDMATEIVSTGVEDYLISPVQFARSDPDHFKFIFDVMHGKYREETK